MTNTLYYGDNLDVMRRHIKDETVDLVYLDPPFKSNQNYNVLFKEQNGSRAASQIRAFEDTWTWGQEDESIFAGIVTAGGRVGDVMRAFRAFLGPCDMLAYLVMMCPRLVELRRVMKPTASIYLHCDPTASHYLKMLMDAVFGAGSFRNEIIWDYSFRLMDLPHFFNRKHDTLLFYAKSADAFFRMPKTTWTREDIIRTRKQEIHVNAQGEEWMWMPGGKGHSKNKPKKIRDIIAEGKAISDVWQLPIVSSSAKERLGYPTQKPEALLERIISASSKPGDVVLDPFCGCGTTIAVAQKLGRQWKGIDITYLAIALIKRRLLSAFGEIELKDGEVRPAVQFTVIGEPASEPDARALAESDPYQFQWWVVDLVNARLTEKKKGADKGIDGKIIFQGDEAGKFEAVIISVKAGNTGVGHVRDLRGVLDREKAAIGVLISMQEPGSPMKTEAATAGFFESTTWGQKYPKIQLLTVADLLAGKQIAMPPIKQVGATFKKAPKVKGKAVETMKLPLPEDGQ